MNSKRLSHLCRTASACVVGLCLVAAVQAQTVYRIVGADGKVTFSDKPPANGEQGKVSTTSGASTATPSTASLPYELRQVVARFPVTLYTTPDCAPCASGRNLLSSRGIPFSERSITTAEDQAALKRLSGDSNLPFLTIGAQRIKGYVDAEWSQYLDAAGYPAVSALPPGYRQPAATPLVSVEKPAAARASEPAAEAQAPVVPTKPARSPTNPAGIQF